MAKKKKTKKGEQHGDRFVERDTKFFRVRDKRGKIVLGGSPDKPPRK